MNTSRNAQRFPAGATTQTHPLETLALWTLGSLVAIGALIWATGQVSGWVFRGAWPPVPPSQRLGKPLPADLEALVLGCLAKDRNARPATAALLRTALLACADAGHYDLAAARTWWRVHRASRKDTPRALDGEDSRPATMAIDLGGRSTEALRPAST